MESLSVFKLKLKPTFLLLNRLPVLVVQLRLSFHEDLWGGERIRTRGEKEFGVALSGCGDRHFAAYRLDALLRLYLGFMERLGLLTTG